MKIPKDKTDRMRRPLRLSCQLIFLDELIYFFYFQPQESRIASQELIFGDKILNAFTDFVCWSKGS